MDLEEQIKKFDEKSWEKIKENSEKLNFLFKNVSELPIHKMAAKEVNIDLSHGILNFQKEHEEYLSEKQEFHLDLIKTLTDKIEGRFSSLKVRIYGSFATELNMPWSDLDIFLQKDPSCSINTQDLPYMVESFLGVILEGSTQFCWRSAVHCLSKLSSHKTPTLGSL